MRPCQVAVSLAACLSLVSAWPGWLPEVDSLVVRQDEAPEASPTKASSPPETSDGAESTDADAEPTDPGQQTNLNTAVIPTGTQTRSRSGTRRPSPSRTQFNEVDPAGSVVMATPAITDGTQLYKIGSHVTFGWSYTDLQGPPTAVDVILSCSAASETWTLTSNMTFQTSAAFIWDSNVQASLVESPLPVEMYTLVIADAEGGISATAEPGYLAPFSGLRFGLYTPAPYVSLADWDCPTCSGASGIDRHALGFAVAMCATTVLTFTWFVTGFGITL